MGQLEKQGNDWKNWRSTWSIWTVEMSTSLAARGPPGPARCGPRAGPGRRLAARTFEKFRYNKQIV